MADPLPCETCGEPLEHYATIEGGTQYRCKNGHWFLLSPALGWLVIPEPEGYARG